MRTLALAAVFLQHLQQDLVAASGSTLAPDAVVRLVADARLGVGLSAYYRRRLTRLEPPYVVHLLLIAAALLIAGRSLARLAPQFVSSLFYVHNFVHGEWHPDTINPVTWSLEIEIQFYLLAPAFAQLFRVKARWLRGAIVVNAALASFALRHWLELSTGPLPPTLLSYLPYFAAGFLLADQHVSRNLGEQRATTARADVIASLAWLLVPLLFLRPLPAATLVVPLALFVAVSSSLQAHRVRRLLASRLLRTVGGMCYSFYLLHQFLLERLLVLLPFRPSGTGIGGLLAAAALYGPLVLALSAVYFVWVEKPCMRRNWWRAGP